MAYIIDGHNLIPKIRGLRLDLPDDEEALIKMLQDFCRLQRKNVEVYFDRAAAGYAGKRGYGRVTAHFVREGSTADAVIISRLRRLKKRCEECNRCFFSITRLSQKQRQWEQSCFDRKNLLNCCLSLLIRDQKTPVGDHYCLRKR